MPLRERAWCGYGVSPVIVDLSRDNPLTGYMKRGRPYGLSDVSTFDYFDSLLTTWFGSRDTSTRPDSEGIIAMLEGISNSVGAGSDKIMQLSRSALVNVLGDLPTVRNAAEKSFSLTLFDVGDAFLAMLSKNLTPTPNDRLLTPLLETMAFLLDARILQRLDLKCSPAGPPFKWRTLLSCVQKSHYRSTSLPRLIGALDVYRGLAEIQSIRPEVIAKVVSMMRSHPFVSVRRAAAEVAWVASNGWERLKEFENSEGSVVETRMLEDFERHTMGH